MTFYHNIFVRNMIDCPEKIVLLQKYMYTKDFINNLTLNYNSNVDNPLLDNKFPLNQDNSVEKNTENIILSVKEDRTNVKPSHKKLESIFFPEKMDNLFWSIFIAIYGYAEYESIGRCYSNREINEKQKIMEFIKNNPKALKNTNQKITKAITQEILSDIMSNKKTTLDVLCAFGLFYKKNIIILNEKKPNIYLKININEDMNEFILLIKNKKGVFGVDIDINFEKIQNILDTKFCLEHYNKPLKAISNYRIDELNYIGEIMGMDTNEKLKKQDLYDEVYKLTSWE